MIALPLLLRQAVGKRRSDLYVMAFFAIYAFALSLFVFRTVCVASAYAVPIVAILIISLFHRYKRNNIPVQRIGLVAAMLALFLPGALAGQMFTAANNIAQPQTRQAEHTTAQKNEKAIAADKCQSVESIAALSSLKNARFDAPFDLGPTILMATPHQVLASSHHRNERAMHDHIAIFKSAPDQSHAIVKQRGITHIIGCIGEGELNSFAKTDPNGLWAGLQKGISPAWLEPMPDMGEGIKIWRVRNEG
jgi:hypothetical protein